MKVLVVEDDRKVAGFIEQGLTEEGHVVDVAPDGDEATMLAHVYDYDVILLDVMLPKKNGFQVATELRREGRNTPILMLTSRDAAEDVVRGLDAGADDYLSKPFRFEELLARMRALVRRGGAERMEVLQFGDIALDRLRHIATVGGKKLDLTAKEFQLLEYFLLHP
jgi:DNA-binding response OmpR family regulator